MVGSLQTASLTPDVASTQLAGVPVSLICPLAPAAGVVKPCVAELDELQVWIVKAAPAAVPEAVRHRPEAGLTRVPPVTVHFWLALPVQPYLPTVVPHGRCRHR